MMPTNLYGPNDHYDVQKSHVIPALILKIHDAKMSGQTSVMLWGSGKALREFIYVDDLADGIIHILKNYSDGSPLNIGSGQEIFIFDLAALIEQVIGYEGQIEWDTSKPDGTPRKFLDCSRLQTLGWKAQTPLRQGLEHSYRDFLQKIELEQLRGLVA